MIASWPGKIQANTTNDHISIFYDYLSTLADIADMEEVPENDGISFLPALLGEKDQQEHPYLYWEFPEYRGQIAIREGDLKFVWKDLQEDNPKIELYDLKEDLSEKNNIAAEYPGQIEKFMDIIEKEHTSPPLERFLIKALQD